MILSVLILLFGGKLDWGNSNFCLHDFKWNFKFIIPNSLPHKVDTNPICFCSGALFCLMGSFDFCIVSSNFLFCSLNSTLIAIEPPYLTIFSSSFGFSHIIKVF